MKRYKFTVFTPCYNGANTIERVFRSIERQTYTNFEWIIINDGSKDASDAIIKNLISHSAVKGKIRYISQSNQGKHRAWNRAALIADSDLFLCADADDAFQPDTLEFYNRKANEIGLIDSNTICGINACAFDHESGKIVGTEFPVDGLVCDNFEMVFKYGIRGDKWMCNRTAFIKEHKFPQVDAPFFPESRIWYAFALEGYKVVCYNKYLMSHYIEKTSLCNGIWYKFNRKVAKAKIIYNFWLLRNAWFRIARLNLIAAMRLLIVVTLKNIGMYFGGVIVELVKIRRR